MDQPIPTFPRDLKLDTVNPFMSHMARFPSPSRQRMSDLPSPSKSPLPTIVHPGQILETKLLLVRWVPFISQSDTPPWGSRHNTSDLPSPVKSRDRCTTRGARLASYSSALESN